MNIESAFASEVDPVEAGCKRRVLIVDDDRDFADSLGDLLADWEWEVLPVYSARTALNNIDSFNPEIALIDLSLGNANGIELVEGLKERRPGLICILITGHADMKVAVEALRSGCDDLFSKPVRPDELFAALERGVAKLEVIQQKEAAEAALYESEMRYRQLVEMAPDAIFVQAGGRFLFANPAVVALLGFGSEKELIGKDVADFIHPDDLAVFLEAYRAFEEDKIPRRFPDIQVVQATGEVRHIETYAAYIDYRGEPAHLVVVHDVTDRRQAEEYLRESQKLEVVSHLTAGIAHDFNNLLAVVMGNLQLLQRIIDKRFLAGNEEAAEITAAALRASRRGADLVKNLMAFARKQPLLAMPTNINHLVDDSLDMISHSLGGKCELRLTLNAAPPTVLVDQTQLLNALLNLIVNARLAMPEGGVVEIATVNVRCEEDESGEGADAGDYVKLSVRDEGVGMTPDVVGRATDPFFTTRTVGDGTGLGLSMVFGFAGQSGGSTKIESQSGKGTTVSVFFPQIDEELTSTGEEQEETTDDEIGSGRR